MAKRSFLVGKMLMTDHNIIKKSHDDADKDKMLVRGKLQCSKSPPFVSSFLIRGKTETRPFAACFIRWPLSPIHLLQRHS